MEKTFIVKQIVQAEKRGGVILAEKTADEKPGVQIGLTFTSPQDAATFVHGAEYELVLNKKP